MANQKLVFVDLDGIIVDFVGGVLKSHNVDPSFKERGQGNYNLASLLGMTESEFWLQLDVNEKFWEDLEKTEEADDLIEFIEDLVEPSSIYFLSSPAVSSFCYSGKAKWIYKHFNRYIHHLILMQQKHFIAAPNRILIDDNDANCNKWRSNRGVGLLFPRPWNSKHHVVDGFDLLKRELRRVLK